MRELRQLESVREIVAYPRPPDDQMYLVSGKVVSDLFHELQKGQRARWLLEEIVNLGTPRGQTLTGDRNELRDQG